MTTNENALFDLTGRVAVVTGAAGGLGAEICSGLAAHGADVALVDLDAEALARRRDASRRPAAGRSRSRPTRRTRRPSRTRSRRSTRRSARSTSSSISRSRRSPARPRTLTLDAWNTAFRINVTSYFLCCRQASQRMIERGRGGAIMNMCSIGGTSAIGRGSFPYSVGKGGIVMLTKEMAVEWARYGIRVNAIQPCQFLTPGLKLAIEARGRGDLMDTFLSGIPLNRLGQPHEIVGPVLFLVSDASSMVTGVLLPVDGGNLALNAGGTKD